MLAVLANGSVSVASLALSVAVARTTSATEFGSFALAMIVFTFASGLIRSAFTDTALSRPSEVAVYARSARRSSLLALFMAVGLLAWGVATSNLYLAGLAVALHGLVALDVIRTFDSAVGNAGRALLFSASWSAATCAAAIASLISPIPPTAVFLTWAVSGAAGGYIAVLVNRSPWRPGWPRDESETKAAGLFALDYLIGSGGSSLTTTLTGVLADTRIVGALRGAGTLLGPVNLIASTARSLTIPLLARRRKDPSAELAAAIRVTVLLAIVIAPLLAILQFIPPEWGEWLLGDTWPLASVVLLPLAIESFLALVGGVPAAGHRVAFAGGRTLALRLAVGVPRPIVVIGCALVWGAPGAAWAMATLALINAVVWWLSYRALLFGRRQGTIT